MNRSDLAGLQNIQAEVHKVAVEHGWWDNAPDVSTILINIHGEVSEAWEAVRKHEPPDEHCPQFSNLEVELADAIIRILDAAEGLDLNVVGALAAKHEFNKSRPYRHGNKKY